MNIVFDGYAYLNIVPDNRSTVSGVLIGVTKEEFAYFVGRERGYTPTDVSKQLIEPIHEVAIAFIAPNIKCNLSVPRSYINTCTSGMSEKQRATWIAETIMTEIFEDAVAPVYENFAA